jgi:hypothetical protein
VVTERGSIQVVMSRLVRVSRDWPVRVVWLGALAAAIYMGVTWGADGWLYAAGVVLVPITVGTVLFARGPAGSESAISARRLRDQGDPARPAGFNDGEAIPIAAVCSTGRNENSYVGLLARSADESEWYMAIRRGRFWPSEERVLSRSDLEHYEHEWSLKYTHDKESAKAVWARFFA